MRAAAGTAGRGDGHHGVVTDTSPDETIAQAAASNGLGQRFAFIYGILGSVVVAAIVGLVIVVRQPGPPKAQPWSTWRPGHGSASAVTQQIADHVASRYRISASGGQLVTIIPGAPELTQGTKIADVSTIGIRVSPSSSIFSRIVPTTGAIEEQLCGLGTVCSIPSGKSTPGRERLLRREALEVALYTFKYVPSVSAVIAYLPPAAGQTPTTVLYLEKANLRQQLSEPLSKTLPLGTPPLPTTPDPKESAAIDRLTLPVEYRFGYESIGKDTEALILTPTSF